MLCPAGIPLRRRPIRCLALVGRSGWLGTPVMLRLVTATNSTAAFAAQRWVDSDRVWARLEGRLPVAPNKRGKTGKDKQEARRQPRPAPRGEHSGGADDEDEEAVPVEGEADMLDDREEN